MNSPVIIVLLVLPYFALSFLIDSRNYEKSLVLSLESTQIEYDRETQTRIRRSARGVELIAFKVESNIKYRYSRTYVTSHVRNSDDRAQEVTFQVILPETAFISKFLMEIDGKTYEAYVKGKGEAKKDYVQAQSRGQSAGLLELKNFIVKLLVFIYEFLCTLSTRHSNVFNVNVNIRANTIVNFNLTYEELLSRRFGRYEQIININGNEVSEKSMEHGESIAWKTHEKKTRHVVLSNQSSLLHAPLTFQTPCIFQVSKTSDVEVVISIEESQPLGFVKALNLQNELEAPEIGNSENPDAKIERPSQNKALIIWHPSSKFDNLKRFIVQYDITRELDSGEVLIMNGYFVHFFAPPNLKPLQKHVVFVLDVSGSMSGRKIEQLKEAMRKILTELKPEDYINMIIFSTDVVVWTPGDTYQERESWRYGRNTNFREDFKNLHPFPANSRNLQLAKMYIDSLIASGSTNINDALIQALQLTARVKKVRNEYSEKSGGTERDTGAVETRGEILPPRVETLIMFLTDGEPTIGVTDLTQIQRNIQLANIGLSVPIFSLAFGQGADFPFLRQLSLQNHAFGRKIYEAADAALQLQGFYGEISSPLLSNVEFNYTSKETRYTTNEITKRRFPTFCDGWEIAVAGRIEQPGATRDVDMGRPIHINDDSLALIKYIPTEDCYFYTSVSGTGYDGIHHWERPLVYMRHPPWWCQPHPHPITTTTVRPEPSQEDSFLERLWAYLTIQNLIEKDMLGSSWTEESPKQKALRLALKYGFVTAQTSLVVIKPDDMRDVANAESSDNQDRRYMSGGSGGGGRHPSAQGSGGGMKSFSSIDNGSSARKYSNGFSSGMAPSVDSTTMSDDSDDADSAGPSKQIKTTSTTKKQNSTPSKPTTTPRQLTLTDIKWLKGSKLTISAVEYQVAKPGKETTNTSEGTECKIGKKGSKLNTVIGKCQHLKNCVVEEFTDDIDIYNEIYFCPIKSKISQDTYAGACCARSSMS